MCRALRLFRSLLSAYPMLANLGYTDRWQCGTLHFWCATPNLSSHPQRYPELRWPLVFCPFSLLFSIQRPRLVVFGTSGLAQCSLGVLFFWAPLPRVSLGCQTIQCVLQDYSAISFLSSLDLSVCPLVSRGANCSGNHLTQLLNGGCYCVCASQQVLINFVQHQSLWYSNALLLWVIGFGLGASIVTILVRYFTRNRSLLRHLDDGQTFVGWFGFVCIWDYLLPVFGVWFSYMLSAHCLIWYRQLSPISVVFLLRIFVNRYSVSVMFFHIYDS